MPSASSVSVSRQLRGQRLGDAARALDVERHAAAEKILRIEPAEQQIGVGDGQLGAVAVADRPRIRAGAARPDAQRAAAVDVGDRSAAGADRVDVDDRQPHRKIADRRVRVVAMRAVDQADVGRRAAHVEAR